MSTLTDTAAAGGGVGTAAMGTPAAAGKRRRRQPPPHGDRRRYTYWGCRCAPCREATRLYEKRHRENRAQSLFVDPTGTARRVQGLVAMGFSCEAIGRALGQTGTWVHRLARASRAKGLLARTAEEVRLVTHRLVAQTPPTGRTAVQARTTAKRHGWHPLGVWDDIDDPNCRPNLESPDPDPDFVDEVAVTRALRGFRTQLTEAEVLATVRAAMARGSSLTRICDRLSVNRNRIARLLAEEAAKEASAAEEGRAA